jgi:hypothetical protein
MILSHKNTFIFIRTQKTASTSMELALRHFCGDNDVLSKTIINPILANKYNFCTDDVNNKFGFKLHDPAYKIKSHINEIYWEHYYKFCFERNSYKKAISAYIYWTRCIIPKEYTKKYPNFKEPITLSEHEYWFDQMINVDTRYNWSDWFRYTEDDEIIVDDIFQFNGNLSKCFDILSDKLGLDRKKFIEYREKTNWTKPSDYTEIIKSKKIISMIEDHWSKEIEYFGYKPY